MKAIVWTLATGGSFALLLGTAMFFAFPWFGTACLAGGALAVFGAFTVADRM